MNKQTQTTNNQESIIPVSLKPNNNNSISFTGTQKFFQIVELKDNTTKMITSMYKKYVIKVENSNISREKPITIKTYNEYAASIVTKISNQIALTVNLAEKPIIEYSLQGLKITGKNISNISKMVDNIENAISTGFILVDTKKLFVFGFSYSLDGKISYRFNSFNEFSKMVKLDGLQLKDFYNTTNFNTNIK